MKLWDRLLIVAYLKSYGICLISLLSLFIVVDLFTNLDDFANASRGLGSSLKQIGTYYGYKVFQIFDRLCEAIALLAAMFTVALMQRNNELLPLLSAGVSTHRVVRPVLVSACAVLALSVANQELVIPRVASFLIADRDDPWGHKDMPVQGAYEPNGIHIEGVAASRKEMLIKQFHCTIPATVASGLIHLTAKQAHYLPAQESQPLTGGWLLTETQQSGLENGNLPSVLEMLDPGKYFLHTQEVDFDMVTRPPRTWYNYASTARLLEELNKPDSNRMAAIAVLFHMRLTRPILGILLVFLGLSVILRDQNRNVFISAGMCLIMCALFFGACFACKHLGDHNYLAPALAAWLPVLVFGPLAFVLFDAIHT